jgi:hypothetical protein
MPPEVIHDGSGRHRRRVDRRPRREHGARLLLLRRLVRFGPAAVAGGTGEDEGDGIAVGDDEPRRSVRERDGPAGGIRVGGCFSFFILFFGMEREREGGREGGRRTAEREDKGCDDEGRRTGMGAMRERRRRFRPHEW